MAKTYTDALAALQDPQSYASNITGQIERIEDSKVVIVNKLINWGELANETGWAIDDAAKALDAVATNNPAIVKEQDGQYIIDMDQVQISLPNGYYKDVILKLGDVSEAYELTTKTVTPTKAEQSIVAGEGYYGLSKVTVAAIPDAYQDVTEVTAGAENVLEGYKIVAADGTVVDGSMKNNGAVTATLDTTKTSYTIPAGYHNGQGAVDIELQEKVDIAFNPAGQTITPDAGKVLSKVTIAAAETATFTGPTLDKTTGVVTANVTQGYTAGDNGEISLGLSKLTANGPTVTATEGYTEGDSVTVTEVALAAPAITTDVTEDGGLKVTATETQETGWTGGTTSSDTTIAAATYEEIANNDGVVTAAVNTGYVAEKKTFTTTLKKANIAANGKTVTVSQGWVDANGLSESVDDGSVTVGNIAYNAGDKKVKVDVTVNTGWVDASATTTKEITAAELDANIVAENIVTGKTILGVEGTFSKVTENAVTAADILDGKIGFVNGAQVEGTMTNNGAYHKTIVHNSPGMSSGHAYETIPAGYHDGTGYIDLNFETVTATPTEEEQTITGSNNNTWIKEVKVKAVKAEDFLPGWTEDADATANDILKGKTAYVDGVKVTGAIENATATTVDASGLNATATGGTIATIAKGTYVADDITVAIDGTIYNRLAQI